MTTIANTQTQSRPDTTVTSANLQKLGGWSGIIAGSTWIFGFAMFVTVFAPLLSGELDTAETVAFIGENQTMFYIWNLVIYVLFGVVQAVLTLAIHERLKDRAPALSQIAAALGLIWSALVIGSGMVANIGAATVIEMYTNNPEQAGTVWAAVSAVQRGIGGGNEIVGGLWVVLLSWAAMRGGLPKSLNIAGMIFGAAGVVTLVPILTDVGALFGLGLIAWYIWCGVVLLRSSA
ncbi:MAG: DUF4386 domain-containing protein [Chloroflexota bacterium]